jgi:hypothetical protein
MNAKLGFDGRLTLSGWPLNQLDSQALPGALRTYFFAGEDTKAGPVCQGDFIAAHFFFS